MMGLPLIGFKNVCLLKYYKQTSGSRIIFVLSSSVVASEGGREKVGRGGVGGRREEGGREWRVT